MKVNIYQKCVLPKAKSLWLLIEFVTYFLITTNSWYIHFNGHFCWYSICYRYICQPAIKKIINICINFAAFTFIYIKIYVNLLKLNDHDRQERLESNTSSLRTLHATFAFEKFHVSSFVSISVKTALNIFHAWNSMFVLMWCLNDFLKTMKGKSISTFHTLNK